MDCKPLQQIACGHAPLRNDDLAPIFHKMSEHMASIVELGWNSPHHLDDPGLWKPRGDNLVADFLVNVTMDQCRSWSKTFDWPFNARHPTDCVFVVHSDGGRRCSSCAACAWIVEVGHRFEGKLVIEPLAMSGTFMNFDVSSFVAETLALQDAILFVYNFVTSRTCFNS